MIPSKIDPSCSSPGEREVFRRLQSDPGTHDWIVLHSLDLGHHPRQVTGEADFVVIIPGKGVLCLEVKAHRHIRRDQGGRWYFGKDVKGDSRGPFKQAAEARYAIHQAVVARRPDLSRIVFWSAVVMPYVDFDSQSVEWHEWQLIDCRRFRSRPLSTSLIEILDKARQHLRASATATWFFDQSKEPYAGQCSDIAEILRPSFECHESPKARAERQTDELKRFTEEQFVALDAMEANPRVAFVGPAGSGKTLLALEAARRSAQSGRRVLLVCFNRLLGSWLAEQASALSPSVEVRTLHQLMQSLAKLQPTGDPSFWDTELPAFATDQMLDANMEDHWYDEIIMDEAQDLLRSNYLDFLDLCLKGGFAAGRWRLFGDFEKQTIYDAANLSLEEFLTTRGANAPRYSLRVNCRNTPRIAGMAEVLGGLEPGYRRYLRLDDGIDPIVLFFQDEPHQQKLFIEALQNLYDDRYVGSDIVVLSMRGDNDSAACKCTETPWRDRLRPFEHARSGLLRYCSIHAFKGLEAPAILVTDIQRMQGEADEELLYVAATRALNRLVLLAHKGVQADFLAAVQRRNKS